MRADTGYSLRAMRAMRALMEHGPPATRTGERLTPSTHAHVPSDVPADTDVVHVLVFHLLVREPRVPRRGDAHA